MQADAEIFGFANCAAGLTEWSSVHNGALVSLGWDWVLLNDGPTQFSMAPPRCNFVLIDAHVPIEPPHPCWLQKAVEAILWKPKVLSAVLDGA